jgi:ubiquinone/menaquinone biosynthesis C-methylase UbiE
MGDDVQRFESWSKTYENFWGQRYLDSLHKLMLELVATEAPHLSPSAILDVGCGTGRLLRRVAARWPAAELIGIDPAQGMVEVAQELMPAARFHQAFAESVPVGEASVDLVLSAVSMHHWSDSSLGAREVARVLRRGGLFCLADISLPAWLSKLFRSKAKDRRAIRDLLIQSGFQNRRQQAAFAGVVLVTVAVKDLLDSGHS